MKIDRDLQIAFAVHNAGIRRARREYAAHPTAACPWRPRRGEQPCDNLTDGVELCEGHLTHPGVCSICRQRQPEGRLRRCVSCIQRVKRVCIRCGKARAEKKRRQCSVCAHGGSKRLAATRRRPGGVQ